MKVLLLADRPTENGVEFWNLLGRQCDLTVAFEGYPIENNIWEFSTAETNFKSVFIQGISLGGNINLSFGTGKLINDSYYDVYVVGNCESNAGKSAIRELMISKKQFVFASEGAFPEEESKSAKRAKSGYLKSASYYLSCGSACDAYFASYGVDMSKVYRYNYAAFSEKDFIQATPMTPSRERGLRKRFRLQENIFTSAIDFTSEQGIDILIDIWNYVGIEDASLLIISDGTRQRELEKMVKKSTAANIVMLDYLPKETRRELIRISKAFIYPAREDVWGMPVVEALSCGVPVISSYNVASVHDLVHDNKTGYVQNIFEPIGWGERMRDIMKRDILWEKMVKQTYSSMQNFTIDSRVKSYMEVFKRCAIMQRK